MKRRKDFEYINTFSNYGCIPLAIQKNNLTLEQILKDIKEEKELENKVMQLYGQHRTPESIAKTLNQKISKIMHIIKFDELGLTYNKVGKRQEEEIAG